MVDLYETDHTFVQALVARAWNVTDGFNGLIVMPNNPLTGDTVGAPVVMRYTPSANLGAINLAVAKTEVNHMAVMVGRRVERIASQSTERSR
jgi:hypothetical protein